MDKWVEEAHGLVWTLAGTGMVLITLSGPTLKWGVIISLLGLLLHLGLSVLKGDN